MGLTSHRCKSCEFCNKTECFKSKLVDSSHCLISFKKKEQLLIFFDLSAIKSLRNSFCKSNELSIAPGLTWAVFLLKEVELLLWLKLWGQTTSFSSITRPEINIREDLSIFADNFIPFDLLRTSSTKPWLTRWAVPNQLSLLLFRC